MRHAIRLLAPAVLGLGAASCTGAAQEPVPTPAPIPGPPVPLRGVPPAEVEALRAGAGMGQAAAAEFNGYPGPTHVLELADTLALTPEQRTGVEAIRAGMLGEARRLGAEVVAGEAGLEASFRGGAMDAEELERRVNALANLRGRLRLTHLRAHLETAAVLSPDQRERYRRLRGHGH